jgi:hypothetical protein
LQEEIAHHQLAQISRLQEVPAGGVDQARMVTPDLDISERILPRQYEAYPHLEKRQKFLEHTEEARLNPLD